MIRLPIQQGWSCCDRGALVELHKETFTPKTFLYMFVTPATRLHSHLPSNRARGTRSSLPLYCFLPLEYHQFACMLAWTATQYKQQMSLQCRRMDMRGETADASWSQTTPSRLVCFLWCMPRYYYWILICNCCLQLHKLSKRVYCATDSVRVQSEVTIKASLTTMHVMIFVIQRIRSDPYSMPALCYWVPARIAIAPHPACAWASSGARASRFHLHASPRRRFTALMD